jgi:Reverse transcriptase (RNA-dependent DNA polymerase)
MDICEDELVTDELQFGFKNGVGFNDASFTLQTVINHFTSSRSSVFSAALDIRKAFDRVPHGKHMEYLRKLWLPSNNINVLSDWYDKLQAVVSYNGALSRLLLVPSGVWQGSVLSPALLNVFINTIIIRLRIADIGCHVKGLFAGCLLYADDVILLSPSVLGLQHMLDVYYSTCTDLGLELME